MSSNKKIYKDAIATFGEEQQIEIMVEEAAELIFAIQKYKRYKRFKPLALEVAEELADVEIMCAQMRLLFPEVSSIKKKKLGRLQELLAVNF